MTVQSLLSEHIKREFFFFFFFFEILKVLTLEDVILLKSIIKVKL